MGTVFLGLITSKLPPNHPSTNLQPPNGAGDRLKEATKINLSLSALGNVISALVDGGMGEDGGERQEGLSG